MAFHNVISLRSPLKRLRISRSHGKLQSIQTRIPYDGRASLPYKIRKEVLMLTSQEFRFVNGGLLVGRVICLRAGCREQRKYRIDGVKNDMLAWHYT